jgi:hypothetical protein
MQKFIPPVAVLSLTFRLQNMPSPANLRCHLETPGRKPESSGITNGDCGSEKKALTLKVLSVSGSLIIEQGGPHLANLLFHAPDLPNSSWKAPPYLPPPRRNRNISLQLSLLKTASISQRPSNSPCEAIALSAVPSAYLLKNENENHKMCDICHDFKADDQVSHSGCCQP